MSTHREIPDPSHFMKVENNNNINNKHLYKKKEKVVETDGKKCGEFTEKEKVTREMDIEKMR